MSLASKGCNAESVFVRTKQAYCKDTAEADAIKLAQTWLLENGLAPLNDAIAYWVKAQQELAAMQSRENEKLAEEESRLRKEGYTHKVTAWIHSDHGDDRRKVAYYKGEPSKRSLSALVRGSIVKNDYKVTSL